MHINQGNGAFLEQLRHGPAGAVIGHGILRVMVGSVMYYLDIFRFQAAGKAIAHTFCTPLLPAST